MTQESTDISAGSGFMLFGPGQRRAEAAAGEQGHGYQCVATVKSLGALGQCSQQGVGGFRDQALDSTQSGCCG